MSVIVDNEKAEPHIPSGISVKADRPWHRFVASGALSQPVFFTVLFLLTGNRLTTVIATHPEAFSSYVYTIAPATFATWALFSIGAVFAKHLVPRASAARAAVIFFTYAATGVAREIMLIASPGVPVTTSTEPVVRVVTALLTSIVMFPVIAAFIGDVRNNLASVAAVRSAKTQLLEAIEWSTSSLETHRVDLVEGIRRRLTEAFDPFINPLEVSSTESHQNLEWLGRITEVVVQPMSSQLAQQTARYRAIEKEIPQGGVKVWKILDAATRANPFRPGLYLWAATLTVAPVYLFVLTWPQRFWASVAMASIAIIHFVATRTVLHYFAHRSLRWRVTVTTGVYVASLLPTSGYMFAFRGGTAQALWTAGFSIVIGLVFLGASAAMNGLRLERQSLTAEFDATKKQLEWKVARINSQAWIEQRNLATFLHGEVQSILLLAQMKIHRAAQRAEGIETVVREVRELLRDIPAQIDKPHRPIRFEHFRGALHDRWGSFLDLSFECTDESRLVIEQDPVSLNVAKEIVSEFVLNAVKHGNASRITVSLVAEGSRLEFALSSSRDGKRVGPGPTNFSGDGGEEEPLRPGRVGVGSEFFDSVILDRRESETAERFLLTGAVPLAVFSAASV